MKGITTLIRLSKRTLDELRKKQVALEQEKESLLQASKKLADELHKEMNLAAKTPEMGGFYGKFSKRIQKRQSDVKAEITRIEGEIAAVAEQIMQAFSEIKRYEIVRDNAVKTAKYEALRKETADLDEISTTRFLRNQQE